MKFKDIKSFSAEGKSLTKIYHTGNVIWKRDFTTTVDSTELIAGDLEAGFYGEVPAKDFITGDEFCSMIEITEGTSQFSDEPWLKFSYLGEPVFVSKKPIRYKISWNHINEKGCVFGEKIVTIKGKRYKVTLLKGKKEGMQDDATAYDGAILHNSMWNRLMGQISEKAPDNWNYPSNMENTLVNWGINYTSDDLGNENGMFYKGCSSWCQDYGHTNLRLTRGLGDVSASSAARSSGDDNRYGFRPALILIDE